MLSNSDASVSRPTARTLSVYIWPAGAGACPRLPAATCTFCCAQRVDDVIGGDLARRHPIRIEPEPHRVLALAEDRDVADAGDPLDRIPDEQVQVVAHEQRVVFVVLGIDADRRDEPGRLLLHGDAGRAHVGRHASQRLVDPVLHVDLRQVLIAGDVERDGDRREAAVRARGGHVEHALHAVDRLLERGGDRGLDFLGVRAGVDGRHGDLRRRQRGILRDRHGRNREQSREDQDERTHRRENRPTDEGVNEHKSFAVESATVPVVVLKVLVVLMVLRVLVLRVPGC